MQPGLKLEFCQFMLLSVTVKIHLRVTLTVTAESVLAENALVLND